MLAAAQSAEAIALAPTVGWLLLLGGIACASLALVGRETWRRWWLRTEDPRPIAVFRVLFALLILVDIDGLGPHLTFLFTDEGLFSADNAQELFAAAQFRGYGDGHDGDPRGFFGLRGFLQLFTGTRFSLLYFWDTPTALWVQLVLFNLAGIALALGYRTRAAAVLTFFLFNSFLHRNTIFWEGTELVLRCLFFYLLLARSGHALSVDNWLRCRRLRREGLLSEPGGPGDGAGAPPSPERPAGLAAIYRRIPAWPRRLMILQVATIYLYTGAVKNGAVWASGDALYYALNLDHFYRFYPQAISAALGTNLFRLMTWTAKAWELLFPLVIVGMIIRWRRKEALPRRSPGEQRIATAAWITLGLSALAIVVVTLPVHTAPDPTGDRPTVGQLQLGIAGAWILGMLAIAGLARALRRGSLHIGPWSLDPDALIAWTLGRRVWLSVGVALQLILMLTMSIGVFQPIMLSVNVLFLRGPELRRVLAWLRIPGTSIPAEDPSLPHLRRDPTPLPRSALIAALVLAVVGVLVQVLSGSALTWRPFGAVILGGLILLVLRTQRSPAGPTEEPAHGETTAPQPFAYGPLGRLLVSACVLVQCVGLALWMLPDKGSTSTFREPARRIFQPWIKLTQTSQSWGMFAPNPPTANAFLRVVVVDTAGDRFDLNTDVYAPENMPIPQLGYDRIRKVNRRVLSDGARYRPWIARYHCRRWALEHGGELPREVELYRVGYRIPPPEELADEGPYDPAVRFANHGYAHLLMTEQCATTVEGQPDDRIRERYGLPPAAPGTYRPNAKHRLEAWRAAHGQ